MVDVPLLLPVVSPALGSVVLPLSNDWFSRLLTQFAASTAPTNPVAYMLWLDITTPTVPVLKRRNSANSAWEVIARLVPGTGATEFRNNSEQLAHFLSQPYVDPLINGDFGVRVRDAVGGVQSEAGVRVFFTDRWCLQGVSNLAGNSCDLIANTTAIGHFTPPFFVRITTSGQDSAAEYSLISQRIESVHRYAGQTITVFGWGKKSAAGNIAVTAVQNFGTGGSPSAQVFVNATADSKPALGTSWGPWKAKVVIPSTAGKTLGTNDDDYLELRIWNSAGTNNNGGTNTLGYFNGTCDLWGIHTKPGDCPISVIDYYQRPDPQEEFERCRRYYQFTEQCARVSQAAPLIGAMTFTPPMRAIPTLVAITYSFSTGATWTLSSTGMVQSGAHGGNAAVSVAVLDAEL